ncbi:hypothetical protein [Delftia tsuruhatensis]|uniref:hypothetical protein n=1 Tax=Delftia tsuruhatensis TaxID=180282 RepID=UPI0028A86871|nr:hypothetical protein [Delftia tsuruhatensis]
MSGPSFHTPGHPVVPGLDFAPHIGGLEWMQDMESRQDQVPSEHDQPGIAQGPDLSAAATFNHAASPAFGESSAHEATAQAPAKTGKTAFLDSSRGRRSLMAVSLAGIALLGYLQYGPSIRQVPDLLGTNLPSVGTIEPSGPDELRAPIDPRLGGLDQLGISELDTSANPAQSSLAQPQGLQAEPEASALVAAPVQAPVASAPATAADPELAARMQRMEAMMIELSQQLAHMREQDAKARAATPAVAQAVPAPAPTATEPHTARPATSAPRVLVKAQPARAATSRPAVNQKAATSKAAPAEKPAAPALSGQLIAVDMWNGEPSVVVASGIPGDRRMRVLRPGDVVNGMALKSADPVSRTATFVAPGSPGLTLSVSQGG